MKNIGTVVRGIKTPVIKENCDLSEIVVKSLLDASKEGNFEFNDRDVVAVTEAVVGISEGNFATLDDIVFDIKRKLNNSKHIGVVFPIISRNRFAVLLSAIARSTDKVTVMLSYPKDEVGNSILYESDMEKYNINPYSHLITEDEYMDKFHHFKHEFTGVNYVDIYKDIIEKENCSANIILSNNVLDILKYTNDVIVSDIHTREITKKKLLEANANVISLTEILNEPVNGSGYNPLYGLLGSNRATDERVKLFPRTGDILVKNIQKRLKEVTGKNIEVMVYGDGAFKDPVGKIWELADPVVSPAYTEGLNGSPNELKLKYLSENKFKDLSGETLNNAIKEEIKNKASNLKGTMATQGTTPRRYVDLIGSLCDLTSGSGDKGTPVVLVQNYFTNYSEE